MPTLQEISEQAAAAHEKCVRESMAMDYAYLADMHDFESTGKPGSRLHGFIEQKHQELIGGINGNG